MNHLKHLLKITIGRIVVSFLSILIGLFLKLHLKKDIFIICDRWNEARDNGYSLFKYLRNTYPDKPIYYIYDVSYKNSDYKNLMQLGNIIPYGSLKMFSYLYFSTYVASSHTDIMWLCRHWLGKKNWNNKITCFLQHGVTKDKLGNYLHFIKEFSIILTGSAIEHSFLLEETKNFSITPIYTGFSRWDRLHDLKCNQTILVMPTWRQHLIYDLGNKQMSATNRLAYMKQRDYFLKWQEFLDASKLLELVQNSNVHLIFYAHPTLYNTFGNAVFSSQNPYISIANPNTDNLQKIIEKASLLVTDFSSIFFEFAYMKRPMIYYQFDEEEFRANHWQEGYFSYKKDGFGSVFHQLDDVIEKIEYYINNNFYIEKEYIEKIDQHFKLYDNKNSERTYDAIINFSKGTISEKS